jgi:hypothetical protein
MIAEVMYLDILGMVWFWLGKMLESHGNGAPCGVGSDEIS